MSWKIFSAREKNKTSVRLYSPTQQRHEERKLQLTLSIRQTHFSTYTICATVPTSYLLYFYHHCTYFCALLVEEVVVDFDFGVGFKVIRQQHNRNRHLVQIIDLQREKRHLVNSPDDC